MLTLSRALSACLSLALLGVSIGQVGNAQAAGWARDPYSLECSAEEYALGDSVHFRWTNNTDSSLVASSTPPYEIYDMATDELIYAGPYPMEYWLSPQSWADFSWDQLDSWFHQAPPGHYRVSISFVFNGNPPPPSDIVEDTFEIVDPTPVESGTWGRVKALYR